MKSEDNTLLEAKVADRNERAKKLYRYVADVARRIGDAIAGATTVTDLFTTNLEVQRQKLRDNCEKLLFFDPVNYGRKSLELIWRKAYYEVVSTSKKLRQADSEYDSYLFTHIVCGIGHFHHIMAKIQSEMVIQVRELDYIEFHKDIETEDLTTEVKEDVHQFGRFALYSCLMYLGDLTRYQAEMFHTFEPSIAARYYLQAAHIDMTLGMPYNQLGNLYLDKNYNLDSVSYYIHCLSCDTPFEGAMGNLMKIFDKYSQYCDFNGSTEYSQSEHIQNTVANFLSLIEIWYLDKNDTNISERCNSIAHGLKIAFDFKPKPVSDLNKNYKDFSHTLEEESINPSYLNNNLVHKIVEICLFSISKMMESDETKAFACKAFTLALLAQLLQKLSQQLESFGFKNPANKYMEKMKSLREPGKKLRVSHNEDVMITEVQTNGTNENKDEGEEIVHLSNDDGKKLTNGELKNNNKKILTKRRRRRRITSINSSDASEGESEHSASEIVVSCSEEEDHISDSSISEGSKSDGSNEDSDLEVFDAKINGQVGEVTKKDGQETSDFAATKQIPLKELSNDKSPGQQSNNDDELKEKDIQNFLLGDNILPSLKLLQDWVHLEKDLILSCGDSGEPLFQSVVDLLNIFSHYFDSNNDDVKKCKILEYSTNIARKLKLEYKIIPLPEDVNLRGTNICKYDKDAAEWQILDRYKPTVYEENVIRILNFIDFGSQIANIVPQIKFNRTMKIYYLKRTAPPKLNTKISHKRGKEWHAAKKQEGSGLLRRLGRLWLAARVRELERAEPPALLAVDAHALADHLRIVKLLLKSKSFVLLVPTIVLQELDELKKTQSGARDAIRWLESALRGGGRTAVRAQRPGQTRALPLVTPRRASPRLLQYINILEFCHHFVADDRPTHAGDGDDKSTPLLVLLIGNEHVDEEFKDFSLKSTARAAGISVQYIGDFYTKWRQTHRSGKKR